MKCWFLILIFVSCNVSVFAQKKYYQNEQGQLFDTLSYSLKKQGFLKKMQDSLSSQDLQIKLNEHLLKIRETTDSLIYRFRWEIILSSPTAYQHVSFKAMLLQCKKEYL